MASVFQKILQTGAKIGEAAAPVVGGIIGGPAGAAGGKALAGGIKKVASMRALGGAGSHTEAKAQDHARMAEQYGLGNNGG